MNDERASDRRDPELTSVSRRLAAIGAAILLVAVVAALLASIL